MRKQRGFTLIELMVTVAVIAILAAVALPSYSDYVKRGKIQEATTNLLAVRTKLEQYYQDNRRYDGGCTAGMPANQKYFGLACTFAASPSQTYTVTATGQQDMNGFTYTIDQANTRSTTHVPTGWSLPSTNCWATKKSGQC
ncbi:MAG TPA: type IV pilin protein [Burkholderiales bacterium]|jgi:type IV pilus assembly protein PilE